MVGAGLGLPAQVLGSRQYFETGTQRSWPCLFALPSRPPLLRPPHSPAKPALLVSIWVVCRTCRHYAASMAWNVGQRSARLVTFPLTGSQGEFSQQLAGSDLPPAQNKLIAEYRLTHALSVIIELFNQMIESSRTGSWGPMHCHAHTQTCCRFVHSRHVLKIMLWVMRRPPDAFPCARQLEAWAAQHPPLTASRSLTCRYEAAPPAAAPSTGRSSTHTKQTLQQWQQLRSGLRAAVQGRCWPGIQGTMIVT